MIEYTINAACEKRSTLALGRQMENNYRQIVFDCSGFEGVTGVMLVHQRQGDSAPYIVASVAGDTLTWTITDTDTAFYGLGNAELRVTIADGLAKSVTYSTFVARSITGDTEIPTALQSWYDAMIDYIDEHAASPEQIEAAVEAYLETHPIDAPVTSVNGMTGAVVLTASDVGALADSVIIPTKTSDLTNDSGYLTTAVTSFNGETGAVTYTPPVSSVNGKTGAVSLNSADVGALPDTYTAPVTSVNNKTGLVTLTATDVGALPNTYVAPVQSVNGQTGAVTISVPTKTSDLTNDSGYISGIDSADVVTALGYTPYNASNPAGYVTSADVPTKTSDLTNDSGYITSAGAPVQSVNGQTGAVTTPNTTYTLSMSGNVITLTPSSGQASSVTLPVYNGGVI